MDVYDTQTMIEELEYLRKHLPGAARRMRILHRLSDGHSHSSAELAAEQKVTVRTLWRDIATLREDGYPIIGQSGEGGGYILRKKGRLKGNLWPAGNNEEGD